MKVIYEGRTIRIILRQGEYLYISRRSAWSRKGSGVGVGEVIIRDDMVIIPFKSSEKIEVRGLLVGIVMSFHWMATSRL
jgi:hypothetical protein